MLAQTVNSMDMLTSGFQTNPIGTEDTMAKKKARRAKEQVASAESKAAPASGSPASTGTAAATTKTMPGRRARRIKVKKPATARLATRAGRPRRQSRRGKRYAPAQRAHILAVARREQLTGEQVAERFGVSTLSFYTWRKKAGSARPGRQGLPRLGKQDELTSQIRLAIREKVRDLLPTLVEEEIGAALGALRPGSRR